MHEEAACSAWQEEVMVNDNDGGRMIIIIGHGNHMIAALNERRRLFRSCQAKESEYGRLIFSFC